MKGAEAAECDVRAMTTLLVAYRTSQLLFLLLSLSTATFSQSQPLSSGSRSVAGRVLRPGAAVLLPVRDVWVTLHRVSSDNSGPLDSARTTARGSYAFQYQANGDPRAIYFVSATYGGVTYFSPPLTAPRVVGEAAELVVYDTTSHAVPITVRGRHLIVSAPGADETRSLLEVFELSNDSNVTRVSPGQSSPATWSMALPVGAREPRAGEGDVPAAALFFRNGRVEIVSPLPPGIKQVSYSYLLPANAFPAAVPLGAAADVYEVLVEEPSGRATGAHLIEVDPVTVEGRPFRRFLARNVDASAVTRLDIPRVTRGVDRRYLVLITIIVMASMFVALARAFRRA